MTARASMKPPANADPEPGEAGRHRGSPRATRERQREVRDERQHPGPREIAAVAGADEHAVEHEHPASYRSRSEPDHRRGRAAPAPRTAGSALKSGPMSHPPAPTTTPCTAPARRPHQTVRRSDGADGRRVPGARAAPDQRLRGDRERVERKRDPSPHMRAHDLVRRRAATAPREAATTQRRQQDRGAQRDGAHEQRRPGAGAGPRIRRGREQRGRRRSGRRRPSRSVRAPRPWPSCVIGGAQPRAGHPHPHARRTSRTDSAALSTAPATATTTGVRGSSIPRSAPVAASTTSIPGIPGADHRR